MVKQVLIFFQHVINIFFSYTDCILLDECAGSA
jgi:hypothetical protein